MTKPGSPDGKGFGGFEDMVSDVSKDIESMARVEPSPPAKHTELHATPSNSSPHSSPQATIPSAHSLSSPEGPSGSGSGSKWFWGIAIGAIVLIAIANSGKQTSIPDVPPRSYDPAPESNSAPGAPPTVAPIASAPREDRPPVGNGLVFSREQIRYCLSQKIRLDAIEKIADASRSRELDAFNALVGDYNSRCGRFKYRRGTLEGVRAEVDDEKAAIEVAAQTSWPSESLKIGNGKKIVGDVQKQPNLGARQIKPTAEQRSSTPENGGFKISKDRDNFKTCIGGDYPYLCKHSLLTPDEAKQVAAAEHRENFKTCIGGDYPYLCKHSLLTPDEARQVAAAEHRENYKTCIGGDYPYLCKHSLLTPDEARRVAAAERRENYKTCIGGDYPYLCKHSLLTPDEARQVAAAEQKARSR